MKQRIITALIMIAIVGTIVFFIPTLFTPLVAIILGIATWEWCRIACIRRPNAYIMSAATIGLWFIASFYGVVMNTLLILSVLHYLYAIYLIYQYEHHTGFRIRRHYLRISGPIVLAALATALIYIFHPSKEGDATTDDAMTLSFIIMVIAAADSGAYFAGRLWGKHKLSPRVSPKKTIEGLIGGLAAVVAVVILFEFMVEGWQLSLGELLFIAIIASLFSVIGDLFISIVKRQNYIKDSSQILPGHGGILDRIDGLLAGVPVFYFLQNII